MSSLKLNCLITRDIKNNYELFLFFFAVEYLSIPCILFHFSYQHAYKTFIKLLFIFVNLCFFAGLPFNFVCDVNVFITCMVFHSLNIPVKSSKVPCKQAFTWNQ